MHFRLKMWHLVSIILMIFLIMNWDQILCIYWLILAFLSPHYKLRRNRQRDEQMDWRTKRLVFLFAWPSAHRLDGVWHYATLFRWCRAQLSTSTLARVLDWSARCSATRETTSRASFSWTKLTPSVAIISVSLLLYYFYMFLIVIYWAALWHRFACLTCDWDIVSLKLWPCGTL